MPTVRVEMIEGRTEEQKRAFVRAVTEAAVRDLASELQHVDVVILEVPKNKWATGGVLFSDVAG